MECTSMGRAEKACIKIEVLIIISEDLEDQQIKPDEAQKMVEADCNLKEGLIYLVGVIPFLKADS